MKMRNKSKCPHAQEYNTNQDLFYMSTLTSCFKCFLSIYITVMIENNIQIHNLKVFSKAVWKRGMGGRLVRVRISFDVDHSCGKLGYDCHNIKHNLKRACQCQGHAVQCLCFPRSKGEGSRLYNKRIKIKQKRLKRGVSKCLSYLTYKNQEDEINKQNSMLTAQPEGSSTTMVQF